VIGLSQKISPKASSCLPWPPPRQGVLSVTHKTLSRKIAQSMKPVERWKKSRKRFWLYGEARMHLECRVPKSCKAAIVYEDAMHMIRGKKGDYYVNEGLMGLPVPREFELEEMP